MAVAEFVLAILEQMGERAVHVAEAEKAKVVGCECRSRASHSALWRLRRRHGGTPFDAY